jgi:hypothetical protein
VSSLSAALQILVLHVLNPSSNLKGGARHVLPIVDLIPHLNHVQILIIAEGSSLLRVVSAKLLLLKLVVIYHLGRITGVRVSLIQRFQHLVDPMTSSSVHSCLMLHYAVLARFINGNIEPLPHRTAFRCTDRFFLTWSLFLTFKLLLSLSLK